MAHIVFLLLLYATTCPSSSKPKFPLSEPPYTGPPIIGKPPVTALPPVANPPPISGSTVCPTTPPPVINPPPASCSANRLKVWARVDLLGGRLHIEVGDPAANQCCEMQQGVVLDLEEAAVCICTTIELKLLNVNVYLALQLPLTTPPVTSHHSNSHHRSTSPSSSLSP